MQKFLDTCPGLVGDIARYINSTMQTEQPGICLAAAFSFMSALLSHRVSYACASNTAEPCLFTVVVADSGSGKTHAQNILAQITKDAGIDTTRNGLLMGVPASDSGLLKALANGPRRFLMWDEMGINLSAYAKTKASHEAMILGTAMKLYTQAGKPYRGKEYATQDRVDIEAPYLSIFGASTVNRWFGALDENMVQDGFVPRLLLFFEGENRKRRIPNPDPVIYKAIVSEVARIERWRMAPVEGDLATATPDAMPRDKLNAVLAPSCTPGDLFNAIDYWSMEVEEASNTNKRGSIAKLMYTRALEQTYKLCLCLADTANDVPTVSAASIDYAIGLVREIINTACEECGAHIYSNDRTREYSELRQKFVELLHVGESITKSQLYRRTCRWADAQSRQRVIEDLVQSEVWIEEREPNQNDGSEFSRKKSITYQRIE